MRRIVVRLHGRDRMGALFARMSNPAAHERRHIASPFSG
jgi:hypothetical protein